MSVVERLEAVIEPYLGTGVIADGTPLKRFVARAILQALREPSPGMIKVGAPIAADGTPADDGERAAESVWQAMIDATLSEAD